jgi:flagellar biosynthesis GTPase FlhF
MYTLLLLTALSNITPIDKAAKLSQNYQYEESEAILKKINYRNCNQPHKYNFYRAVNNFCLNKKEDALVYANRLDGFYNNLPERYAIVAQGLRYELSKWRKDFDNLADISREMKVAGYRLQGDKGGPKTQRIQKQILERLHKKIKDIENAAASAKRKQERKVVQIDKAMPMRDSSTHNEKAKGEVRLKHVREIATVWGKLPPKQKEQAIVSILRTFSSKDRVVIERYFRELARRKSQ